MRKAQWFISFLTLAGMSFLPLISQAMSGQEGHGGDIAVSIFIGVARRTAACMQKKPETWNQNPTLLEDLKKMIILTQVMSVDKTVLKGVEVDAINRQTETGPQILINRPRWLVPNLDQSMRAHLVLHEYLTLAGYDDHTYQISYDVIEKNADCLVNTANVDLGEADSSDEVYE